MRGGVTENGGHAGSLLLVYEYAARVGDQNKIIEHSQYLFRDACG
jgi:hypothetical protein